MKSIAYTCPMCGKHGNAQYHDDVPLNLDYWVKLLHCNRCADFKEHVNYISEKLRSKCFDYKSEIHRRDKDEKQISFLREAVLRLTKSMARIVCNYYPTVYTWEPDFAEQCMEHPDKITEVVNTYIRMIKAKVRPQTILSSDHHRTADTK